LRLQLVELIRASFTSTDSSTVAKAIEFAQQNLAPYATLDPQFKNDLERAMALLIVPKESWTTPTGSQSQAQTSSAAETEGPAGNDFGALAELVDPSLRRKVAKDVNEAILQSQGERREANIRYLVRARAWAEQLARDKKIDLPKRLGLGLDGDETEVEASGSGIGERNGRDSNGHGTDTDMADGGAEQRSARSNAGNDVGAVGAGGAGDPAPARYVHPPS
jgi:glucose-induced degradation protein 8